MLYRFIICLLFLTSCASLKDASVGALSIIGEVVIDEEIYKPLIDNRNSFEWIEGKMKPDDKNIDHFDFLLKEHNKTINNISLEIIDDGTIIYEDYKLEIMQIANQLSIMKDNYEADKEYKEIPDFITTLLKTWIKQYARKEVARQFKHKFSYPVR